MIFSQAAVVLRNTVPQRQPRLLASQGGVVAVSLEQICYSKSSALKTVKGEKREGGSEIERKRGNMGTMYLQRTLDNSRCWLDSPCRAMK